MEFKIRRGPSTILFENYEKKIPNPKLVIEEGCWYLSTDTAELLLGVKTENGQLMLKPMNESYFSNISIDGSGKSAIKAEINTDGELVIYYSDNTSESLGKVIGRDGLTTAIKVGDEVFTHESGTISLPDFATMDYVDNVFSNLVINLTDYVKREELPDFSTFITEIPDEYITKTELDAKGYLTEHQDLSEYAKNTDVDKKIAEAQLDGEVNLEDYATKEDIKDFVSEDNIDDKIKDTLTKVILNGGNSLDIVE